MTAPYGLCADLHLHPWSAFATVTPDGMNSRLSGLLGEIERCAREVQAAGGKFVYFAGDVFHVRGSVSPTVLNATRDLLGRMGAELGITFVIMPGNHDLEGKETTWLSSAVSALASSHVVVVSAPTVHDGKLLVPWIENIDQLKQVLNDLKDAHDLSRMDVLIHAPIDGVIPGLPAHGLTAEDLGTLGACRVFAGHYHNHKMFPNGVFSIGALAHHTWSDVGSKAGFLIVDEDKVSWRKSHLPEFLDLSQLTDLEPEEIPMMVDGNFVRVRVEASKVKEVETAREELLAMGAQGVIVQAQPKPTARTSTGTATVASGASLETSVMDFIKGMPEVAPIADEIKRAAIDVLSAVDLMGD